MRSHTDTDSNVVLLPRPSELAAQDRVRVNQSPKHSLTRGRRSSAVRNDPNLSRARALQLKQDESFRAKLKLSDRAHYDGYMRYRTDVLPKGVALCDYAEDARRLLVLRHRRAASA
eukprot:3973010-Pleurochrysis_carterae.AAC.3